MLLLCYGRWWLSTAPTKIVLNRVAACRPVLFSSARALLKVKHFLILRLFRQLCINVTIFLHIVPAIRKLSPLLRIEALSKNFCFTLFKAVQLAAGRAILDQLSLELQQLFTIRRNVLFLSNQMIHFPISLSLCLIFGNFVLFFIADLKFRVPIVVIFLQLTRSLRFFIRLLW